MSQISYTNVWSAFKGTCFQTFGSFNFLPKIQQKELKNGHAWHKCNVHKFHVNISGFLFLPFPMENGWAGHMGKATEKRSQEHVPAFTSNKKNLITITTTFTFISTQLHISNWQCCAQKSITLVRLIFCMMASKVLIMVGSWTILQLELLEDFLVGSKNLKA